MKNLVKNLKVKRSNKVELSYETLKYQNEIKNEFKAMRAEQNLNVYNI